MALAVADNFANFEVRQEDEELELVEEYFTSTRENCSEAQFSRNFEGFCQRRSRAKFNTVDIFRNILKEFWTKKKRNLWMKMS